MVETVLVVAGRAGRLADIVEEIVTEIALTALGIVN